MLSQNVAGQYDPHAKKSDSLYTKKPFDYTADTPSNQLIKVGLALPVLRQSSFRGFYQTVAFNALAERKVRGFSFLFGLQGNVGFARGGQLFQLELPLDLRYYFSIGRRMKQRSDTHSFWGYYVGIHTQNVIHSRLKYQRGPGLSYFDIDQYERGQILSRSVNSGLIHESFNFMEYVYPQIGFQCKLFDRCFLDANAVVPVSSLVYNKWEYTLASPPFATITFGYRLREK